jgi:hypothetical protein
MDPPLLTVRLAALLGKRKLVDGATGQPILQFSARLLLRPRLLPPRYRLSQVQPMMAAPMQGQRGQPVAGAQQWYSTFTGAEQPETGDGNLPMLTAAQLVAIADSAPS